MLQSLMPAHGMENPLEALQIKCTKLIVKYKVSGDVLLCPLLTGSTEKNVFAVRGCEHWGLFKYPNDHASVRFALTYPVP